MTRDDVPAGKGQCDIRLQVDKEVEVSLHGDQVAIRTISGRDARDDGSECNAPMPDHDIVGFQFEVMDSRKGIRLVAEPSRRQRLRRNRTHSRQLGRGREVSLPPELGDHQQRLRPHQRRQRPPARAA